MEIGAIITAHNEEATIARLLECVLAESYPGGRLVQVVVVSSESTDRTDVLVEEIARRDDRVLFLRESKRRGKCAAINWALREKVPTDVVILLSADVLPEVGALGRLVAPFQDPEVGMTGGRPVPTNDPGTLFGYAAHLLWSVHHRIALNSPKLGEVVAFRGDAAELREELAVDEAAIEAECRERGLRLVYVPDAVIHNRGPDNMGEFLSQRRRIQAGHLHLEKLRKYRVATAGLGPAVRGLFQELSFHPVKLLYAGITASLCLVGRWLGSWDFHVAKRDHQVWDIARSTKHLRPEK